MLRRLISVLALALVSGCSSGQLKVVPPTSQPDATIAPTCAYTRTDPTCQQVVQVVLREVGIASGSTVRVIDPPLGEALRTSADIALVILTGGSGDITLVLVGYVGVDPNPDAWIPDRATYAAWYRQFVPEAPAP